MFYLLAHTACDNNNYILDFHVTSENVMTVVGFINLYKSLKEKYCILYIIAMAMETIYITSYICNTLFDDNILLTLSYKRQ